MAEKRTGLLTVSLEMYMRRARITQGELARRVNRSRQTINGWMRQDIRVQYDSKSKKINKIWRENEPDILFEA